MRIGFNARCMASPHMRGWKRYSICLLRELASLGCEFVLLTDKPLTPEHLQGLDPRTYRVDLAPSMKYPVWEQVWLSYACKTSRSALLHSPMNFGLPAVAPCPTILTLHDAIDVAFQQHARASFRQRLHRVSHWLARRSASKIITVSEHARRDIEKYFGVRGERIVVIPEAADAAALEASSTTDEQLVRSLVGDGDYCLYAGGFEARKNVSLLERAFRSKELGSLRLVLVGAKPPPELAMAAEQSGGRIICTGYVSDEALGALYRRARCFIYPSLYEGFGLQICEALSQGCPVLAANATSLPEVLGQGGDLFDPRDCASLEQLLKRVAHDPSYLQDLRQRAKRRAGDFSWRQTAIKTLAVYTSLATGAGNEPRT